MRIAFMGTPEFAVPTLRALVGTGHEVAAVFTQPPAAAGRGKKLQPSAVQIAATALGLTVHTPVTLKDPALLDAMRGLELDAVVTVAYGLILPPQYLDLPRLGCFNVHASFLPRWRGAAPIQRAIEAGDHKSGISIIQMDRGLDTGPILLKERIGITEGMTALELHDQLKEIGARLAVEVLQRAKLGALHAEIQTEEGATYAQKLEDHEAQLDWTQPADVLERRIRAFNPWLGTWCQMPNGERMKVLAASVVPGRNGATPGMVLDKHLTVACGEDSLRLETVQRAGRNPMTADAFLRGCPALGEGAILS